MDIKPGAARALIAITLIIGIPILILACFIVGPESVWDWMMEKLGL